MSAISNLHSHCIDFLKSGENRKNLSINAGMVATAMVVVALLTSAIPVFPTLCMGGIVGIITGFATYRVSTTLLKILDGGYQNHPIAAGAAAITVLVEALFKYVEISFGEGLGLVLVQSMALVSLSLLYGAIVYEIGSWISDECSSWKKA